jgi:chaperonin cofactor prefoldin
MTKNKIVIEGEVSFQDTTLRTAFLSLEEKIKTLNDRTKRHTIQIKDLKKKLKQMEVENVPG